MSQLVQWTVRNNAFNSVLRDHAVEFGRGLEEETKIQMRLLSAELIQRTPPFSGKQIKRMVSAREGATFRAFDIESDSARKVGEKRVERDIRRVIYGIEGGQLSARHMAVSRGSNPNAEWGTLQRCEGRRAVRLFATKSGEVYGADISQWAPNASLGDLLHHHDQNRGKRGRVTLAGAKTRNVGRWKWLNVLCVPEKTLARYIKEAKGHVGEGKGGWARGFMELGGRMSAKGWIGKHSKSGEIEHNLGSEDARRGNVKVTLINRTKWASGGDEERIIEQSLRGRGRAMARDMKHHQEQSWKKLKIKL